MGKTIKTENNKYKTNTNMAKKQVIRLTESDLHNIIKESVNQILMSEGWFGFGKKNQTPTKQAQQNPREAKLERYRNLYSMSKIRGDWAFTIRGLDGCYFQTPQNAETYGAEAYKDIYGQEPIALNPIRVDIGGWNDRYNRNQEYKSIPAAQTPRPGGRVSDNYSQGEIYNQRSKRW